MLRNTLCCLFLGKLSENYIISKKSRGSYVLHHFKCFKINDCNPSWRWTKKVKFVGWHHFWWMGIHVSIFNISYCNCFSSRTSSFLQKNPYHQILHFSKQKSILSCRSLNALYPQKPNDGQPWIHHSVTSQTSTVVLSF